MLSWKVYRENFNTRKIEEFDIFTHPSFTEEVMNNLIYNGDNKTKFVEELRRSLFYYYGFKCEYEVVIIDWLYTIRDNEPQIARKVDVYSQVRLNWDVFVDYVWRFRGED